MQNPWPTLLGAQAHYISENKADAKMVFGEAGCDSSRLRVGMMSTTLSNASTRTPVHTPPDSPSPCRRISVDKDYSSDFQSPLFSRLVVRNTFLDFPNESHHELPKRRRARSLELPRRSWPVQDIEESSIANVGVGGLVGFVSADVPYRPDLPLEKFKQPSSARDESEEDESHSPLAESEEENSGLPSIGSAGHRLGNCVPCGYFWKMRGCVNGSRCEYCHLCVAREKKRRQRVKKNFFKDKA